MFEPMHPTQEQLEVLYDLINDCMTLFERAFVGQSLTMFGADGLGQYGQEHYARTCTVDQIGALVELDITGEALPFGMLMINLENYDAVQHGHAMTDKNLELSLNEHLAREHIDPTCWMWADILDQGDDHLVIQFDIAKLLEY